MILGVEGKVALVTGANRGGHYHEQLNKFTPDPFNLIL